MKINSTALPGVLILEPELQVDNRGYFARTFCLQELSRIGVTTKIVQCSISYNRLAGTVRGLHYQKEPYGEDKIVSCIRGRIFDVVVELKTGKSLTHVLSEHNKKSLFIPKGYAHGFQTMDADTTVYYQMSEYYNADAATVVKWNDWVLPVTAISERDML